MPKFRTLVPRFWLGGCVIGADDWQAEGWTLSLRWLGIVAEWTIAREDTRQ